MTEKTVSEYIFGGTRTYGNSGVAFRFIDISNGSVELLMQQIQH